MYDQKLLEPFYADYPDGGVSVLVSSFTSMMLVMNATLYRDGIAILAAASSMTPVPIGKSTIPPELMQEAGNAAIRAVLDLAGYAAEPVIVVKHWADDKEMRTKFDARLHALGFRWYMVNQRMEQGKSHGSPRDLSLTFDEAMARLDALDAADKAHQLKVLDDNAAAKLTGERALIVRINRRGTHSGNVFHEVICNLDNDPDAPPVHVTLWPEHRKIIRDAGYVFDETTQVQVLNAPIPIILGWNMAKHRLYMSDAVKRVAVSPGADAA